MPSASPPLTLTTTPKRKRPINEPHPINPPPTSCPRTIPSSPLTGPTSPRTSVAGRLQNLDINELTPLDFSPSATTFTAQITPSYTQPTAAYAPPTPPMSKPLTPPLEQELEVPETPRLKPTLLPAVNDKDGERLWWNEAEITGHDPKDPMDDGEGINGVGFLPVSTCPFQTQNTHQRTLHGWVRCPQFAPAAKRSTLRDHLR